MARGKFKWKFVFFFHLLVLNAVIRSLPIANTKLPNLVTVDTSFPKLEVPEITKVDDGLDFNDKENNPLADVIFHDADINETKTTESNKTQQVISENTNSGLVHAKNVSRSLLRNVRPGQEVRRYAVSLSFDGDSFNGRTVIDVRITSATTNQPIVFHVEELEIQSVMVGVFTDANAVNADYRVDNGKLNINPQLKGTSYIVIVEYLGRMSSLRGMFQGSFKEATYIAMNLHPTNARRVFPCMDELTAATTITFTFNDVPFPNIHANTMLEEGSTSQFRPLQGPPHLWGMVAHNFPDVIIPITTVNLQLHGRDGARFQDKLASVAINNYFNALEEWTKKPYFGIVVNQDERLNIIALPDASMDWYALSTVCIWEPDILMPAVHSVKQRKNVIVKVAESLARQWFGFVIYPEDWRSEWVTSGLATYSAYELAKNFQSNELGEDVSLVDMETIFLADVIHESMYYDAYSNAPPLEPGGELSDEASIRQHINGPIQKHKAPVILRMLRLVLGKEDDDYIQLAAQSLLSSRALQTVTSSDFYAALNSHWFYSDNKLIENIADFLRPWVQNRGYPLIHVGLIQGGVLITKQHFAFAQAEPVNFMVPLTFTTSINPNFEMENVHNIQMMHLTTTTIDMDLNDGQRDYVLFNIRGQGYYRVNYDDELWNRIIEALENPETRQQIHPLNRATLVDDALNLARAGKLDYDVAFRLVLTMEHETEYAVWKAFVRNMEFIRKRLVAWVEEDQQLDPDIYSRIIRRTVIGVEQEFGFNPDPLINEPAMASLTRGLVMDHACRANYPPCIAAAVDWFYAPGAEEPTVNPDIPPEIRPAVYCTMVKEGDDQVVAALYSRLEIEDSMYERLVILESLACSRDEGFIGTLLQETIAGNSPYGVEERVRIFKAIAGSSYQNARIAINFMRMRTNDIRNSYGGPQKLEELLNTLADNMVGGLPYDFQVWVNSNHNNLEDSAGLAERLLRRVEEDGNWDNLYREDVYEWINTNDAPTVAVSVLLLTLALFVTLFNN